jgi:FAD/FMN-containing dehydrogenase
MNGGIQINMRKMNAVEVNDGKGTVTVGGGTLQPELVDYLATRGKQTGKQTGV